MYQKNEVKKVKSFTVTQNDAGQRLDRFVTKVAAKLPQSMMYRCIRQKKIKLNGKRAEISTRIQAGDLIEMYINDEFFAEKEYVFDFMSAGKKLDIVYEDENILLLNKKEGLLCHADKTAFALFVMAQSTGDRIAHWHFFLCVPVHELHHRCISQ